MRSWSPSARSGNLALTVSAAVLAGGCAGVGGSLRLVAVPVTDLRAKPHTAVQPGVHDPLQETQLLYGERVRVRKQRDGWSLVEAIEQPEYTHARRWQGYPGWLPDASLIDTSTAQEPTIVVTAKWARAWLDAYGAQRAAFDLPMGTLLHGVEMGEQVWRVTLLNGDTVWLAYRDARPLHEVAALPEEAQRRQVLNAAERLIGDPYVWGGRSPAGEGTTGVDCSGLVNLAHRTIGMVIPRDAHEQYLKARPVSALKPGDLIFLSERGNPRHITHVMLYTGDGEVIEGPGTGERVRRISVAKRLNRALDWIMPGTVLDDQTVFFGTFVSSRRPSDRP